MPNYKEFGYAVTGFAGETQNFDGNGPYIRFQTGGGNFGTNDGLVSMPVPGSRAPRPTWSPSAAPRRAPVATQPVLGPKPPYNARTSPATRTRSPT